jgi:hypothetical protein
MIIILGGRKGNGKSSFSSELEKIGYTKISFADYLRYCISTIYNMDILKLKTQDGKAEILQEPLQWNEEYARKLFILTGINDYPYLIIDKTFNTRRDALQYIGSDILRKYDDNFHVKRTIQNIDPNKNYVCDDIRYLNELNGLKNLGAVEFYVIRSNNFDISNHSSEVSLNWSDFRYQIINNRELKSIQSKFIKSIELISNENFLFKKKGKHIQFTRSELIDTMNKYNHDTNMVAKHYGCSRDKIIWWCNNYMINVSRNTYTNDQRAFLTASKEAAYYAGLLSADGCIKKSGRSKYNYVMELSSDDYSIVDGFRNFMGSNKPIFSKIHKISKKINYTITINCPFVIENIKYWNLKPRKSKYNEIPDIIKNDQNLLKFWLLGLIDGDGSIYVDKQDKLFITFLASKEIAIFYTNMYKHLHPSIRNHKKIENLYCVSFYGSRAIDLYKDIYDDIALPRKWDKVKEYYLKYPNLVSRINNPRNMVKSLAK